MPAALELVARGEQLVPGRRERRDAGLVEQLLVVEAVVELQVERHDQDAVVRVEVERREVDALHLLELVHRDEVVERLEVVLVLEVEQAGPLGGEVGPGLRDRGRLEQIEVLVGRLRDGLDRDARVLGLERLDERIGRLGVGLGTVVVPQRDLGRLQRLARGGGRSGARGKRCCRHRCCQHHERYESRASAARRRRACVPGKQLRPPPSYRSYVPNDIRHYDASDGSHTRQACQTASGPPFWVAMGVRREQ